MIPSFYSSLLPSHPSTGSQHVLHSVYMVLGLEPTASCTSGCTLPTQLHVQSQVRFFRPHTKSKTGFFFFFWYLFIYLNIARKRKSRVILNPHFLLKDNLQDILKFMFLLIFLLKLPYIKCLSKNGH